MRATKRAAVILSICLLLQMVGENQVPKAAAAVTQIPMAEYYQQVMTEGKAGADVAGEVILSSWQDFLLFRECMSRKNATAGVRFIQQADIKASNVTFSYDEKSDRTAVYRNGTLIGAIGRDKRIFETLSGSGRSSLSSMGLENAYICNDDSVSNSRFYGTYDGGGHSIEGILFESLSQLDSGLFGWIYDQGAVQNVNVRNCCMMYAYAVFSGYNFGRIENCRVSGTVGFGFDFGGIVGINDGIVQNCNVAGCEFMKGSLSGEIHGGIGGIVSCMILGTARSCEVTDTVIRGFGEEKCNLGGIIGTQESNTPWETGISCINCTSDATLMGGYSMGGICGSMEDDWEVSHINAAYLKNCLFMGTIRQGDQDICYAGGIIGKVKSDSEIYIADCINRGKIYRRGTTNQYSGAIGGILGEATGDAVIFSCHNQGKIMEDKEETAREGQITYIGGLVGEANRQLRLLNSNNEGDIEMGLSHTGDYIGGLAGKCSDNTRQYIANNCNSGNLSGYRTAGLVAVVENKENSGNTGMKIENCVNFGSLRGTGTSGLAGTITAGGFLRCYTTHTGALVSHDTGAVLEESSSLTQDELSGLAAVLSEGARNMTALSDYGYMEKYEYAPWQSEGSHSPVPQWEGAYTYPSLTTLDKGADTSAGRVEYPDEDPAPTPTVPAGTPDPTPTAPAASSDPNPTQLVTPSSEDGLAVVKGFQIKENTGKKVSFKWKKGKSVKGYILYRSTKKDSGFKMIAKAGSGRKSYTDKKVKKGKTYYYQIRACYQKGKTEVFSKPVTVKVKIPYLAKPVIALKKGKLASGTRYMQVSLKKTDGKYVQVYLRQKGKAFSRVRLKDNKISRFKKKIRFSYRKGKKTYYCKIRTYQYIKGKKRYSGFSQVKKIKL